MKMDNDQALTLLEAVDHCGLAVSDWEAEFIDAMMKKIEERGPAGRSLTPGQVRKLQEIHGRYC